MDAFSLDWLTLNFYALLPFSVVLPMLNKIQMDKARGVCVVPDWPTQGWYRTRGTRANSTQSEGRIIDFAQSSNGATSITSESVLTGCSLIRERLILYFE